MGKNNNSKQNPEKMVEDFFNHVWSLQHDLTAIDTMMTDDYIITTGGKVIKGREAFKAWVGEFQQLLTNAVTVNLEAFSNATGDRVVSRWVCTGNNNGIFGLPPDGRPVSFTGIAIWKIRDDKLAECWVERSAFELYKQLVSI